MKITLLIVLFTWIMETECSYFKIKGNNIQLSLYLNYLRDCEFDKDSLQKFFINFRRFNHTAYGANLNWTVSEPFDSSYSIHFETWKWGDGGWKKNFINVDRENACLSLYTMIGPVVARAAKAMHANVGCPVLPGFYRVDNFYSPDGTAKGPLMIWPGKFYSLIHMMKNGKVAACVEFEFELREESYVG